jgi:hypothetical protein
MRITEGCYINTVNRNSMSMFGGDLLRWRLKLVSGTLRDHFRQNSIQHLWTLLSSGVWHCMVWWTNAEISQIPVTSLTVSQFLNCVLCVLRAFVVSPTSSTFENIEVRTCFFRLSYQTYYTVSWRRVASIKVLSVISVHLNASFKVTHFHNMLSNETRAITFCKRAIKRTNVRIAGEERRFALVTTRY